MADLSFRVRVTNYFGGTTDDQRYLEAALAWLIQGPHAGTTHWSLRHPLVLSIVASFKAFGISIASLQLVPRLYADLLVAVTSAMLARTAGPRAALLWVALALTSPILHEMATSCFPEMLELTFGAVSLWLFWEARKGKRWSGALLLGSGAALALATLTRETAVGMLALYAFAWARGHARPFGALWFAAGFLPLIAFDTLWLWSHTGDLLYRLHVDESHIGIYSDHLRGGVYHGRAFLNPDLASRWLPSGPVRLHWAIDPLLNFFADPRFGLVFIAWAVLALARPTRPLSGTLAARAMPTLLAVATISYLVVTWALTLRPQPRYYLFAVYAATIAVALLAGQPLRTIWTRRLQGIFVGLVLFGGVITILFAPDRQRDARVILPWLERHPDTILHFERKEAERLAFPAILASVRHQVSARTPAVGEVRVRVPSSPGTVTRDRYQWQRVTTLSEPRLFPYLNRPRQLIIERRLR
ncbi:ArnT family glycosyltransferase [Sphingomonas sp. UYAg733]